MIMQRRAVVTICMCILTVAGLCACGKEAEQPETLLTVADDAVVSSNTVEETEDITVTVGDEEIETTVSAIEEAVMDVEEVDDLLENREEMLAEDAGMEFVGTQVGYQQGMCYVILDGKGLAITVNRLMGTSDYVSEGSGSYTFTSSPYILYIQPYVGGLNIFKDAMSGIKATAKDDVNVGSYTFKVYEDDVCGYAYCESLDFRITWENTMRWDHEYSTPPSDDIIYILKNHVATLDLTSQGE